MIIIFKIKIILSTKQLTIFRIRYFPYKGGWVFGTAPLHIFSAASCILAKQVQLHPTPPKAVLHKFHVFLWSCTTVKFMEHSQTAPKICHMLSEIE